MTLTYKSSEIIMERLLRLDPNASVRMRPNFLPGPMRWYLSMGKVVLSSFQGGFSSFFGNGSTPEEAILDTWSKIINIKWGTDRFFLKYNCKGNEIIPDDAPQVWVRWSTKKQDWEDVVPPKEVLERRCIPANRIQPYTRPLGKRYTVRGVK